MCGGCGNTRFVSVKTYIGSKETLRAKIIAIEALIDAMILSIADSVETANISSYEMDDGQMTVQTGYRSMQQVTEGVNALEAMKQMYLNRLNGRTVLLRDTKTFR